jgi:formylglycine-generating enzyme required for sulfatase activity
MLRTSHILLIAFIVSCLSFASSSTEALEAFRDCADCPELVVVPPGRFTMGDDASPFTNERPAREMAVERGFALGRTEVTFDDWARCLVARACQKMPDDHGWGRGKRPVINVTLAEATQFLAYLSQKTGKPYRLPTEAEWEHAARAGTKTAYWWGETAGAGHANCRECESGYHHETAPAASFAPNPFGLHDMNGNVWEWTADCWRPNHAGAPERAKDGTCPAHVVKGGSWYYFPPMSRPAARARNDVRTNSYNIGFRVARDLN